MDSGKTRLNDVNTYVSAIVGLLGLFIALWLTNRERNKKISENHFYKLQILWHIWKILCIAGSLYEEWKMIDQKEQLNELSASKDKAVKELREASEYHYHKSQIEVLNTNMFVPSDIRHYVLLLVRTGGTPLNWHHSQGTAASNIISAEKLLNPLDRLIDSEYFTKDRDKAVKKLLNDVGAIRRNIREEVDSWRSA